MKKKKLIMGVLNDIHNLGLRVLEAFFLKEADFEVIYIGARLTQEEFIRASLEVDADVILISSSNGHAEIDARGMREKCQEAGIGNILLYIGGNLVITRQSRDWAEVEATFKNIGFDRAYPAKVQPQDIIKDLKQDLALLEK